MKQLFSILLLALNLFGCANYKTRKDVQCDHCSDEVLYNTMHNQSTLSYQEIENFFCTLDPSCQTAVEFSEVSNELLFEIFAMYPGIAIAVLERSNVEVDFIVSLLADPINDGIDVITVKISVSNATGNKKIKEAIIAALNEAAGKISK